MIENSLVTPPVLKLLQLGVPYILDTVGSDTLIGCSLLQTQEKAIGSLTAYCSRGFS